MSLESKPLYKLKDIEFKLFKKCFEIVYRGGGGSLLTLRTIFEENQIREI